MNSKNWQIIVNKESEDIPVKEDLVVELLKQLLDELSNDEHVPKNYSEVSVTFCRDKEIQKLNSEYRNKDLPTDVLSFSQIDGEEFPCALEEEVQSLGDIVISYETAERQYETYSDDLGSEVLRLLVHGLLHLLGFDHENVPDEKRILMEKTEDVLCEKFKNYASSLLN